MKREGFKSIFTKAVLAGIMIGIGGTIYLCTDNKYIGSLLFSLGLFTILRYEFALYTGKVGYIPERPAAYIRDVLITLLGNVVGTGIIAGIIRLTRVGVTVHQQALLVMEAKTGDSLISQMLLGVLCGLLMYIAVDNGKRCTRDNKDASFVFGTTIPVMVFILCGFNHSIADCFYLFAAVETPAMVVSGTLYILTVACGNAIGGMLIPFTGKMFDK